MDTQKETPPPIGTGAALRGDISEISAAATYQTGHADASDMAFACDERAVDDDRRWFASHPRRCHRIRHPGIGERRTMRHAQPDDTRARPFVVVRQVVPGVRMRQPAWLGACVPNLEAIAHGIFDLMLEAVRKGRDFIPPEVVRQRIALLAHGGWA